jgi:hypothetical protein
MYTIIAVLSIVIIIGSLILTVIIAANQKEEKYKSNVKSRFMNLIWIYVIGIGSVIIGLLAYIYM